ncbi:MAG: LysE family translocator [Azospirillaceae bacterium]|nr:LysE family translocator [Azospirillaceae bacterium]
MSINFLITTLIVVLAPGTGVLYTLGAGLSHGKRASLLAALGCTLGIVPHLAAALLGLAAVLHASALAFQSIKIAGVGYLLLMAWQTLKDNGSFALDAAGTRRSPARIITSGILLNILNPKLSIFFFAFLPQFVTGDEAAPLLRISELGGIFMAVTLVVFIGYGLFAAQLRRFVIGRTTVIAWMRRTFAASFVALGVKLALAER